MLRSSNKPAGCGRLGPVAPYGGPHGPQSEQDFRLSRIQNSNRWLSALSLCFRAVTPVAERPQRARRSQRDVSFLTWTVGDGVKVAVGEHEVLRAALWLQPDHNVGDAVIEAGEAPKKVNGEGPGGALHVHRQLMGARRRLTPDVLDLLQQVAHCQDFILLAAHGPGADAGDLLQVAPGLGARPT